MEVDPERALSIYRGNVEVFEQALPIVCLIGAHLTPVILDLPADSAELVAPEMIRAVHGLVPPENIEVLTQALLSVEVEVMMRDRPFMGVRTAVAIYSAGAQEFRLIAPFKRTAGATEWDEERAEVVIGPALERDPVVGALRYLVEASS